jgi:hypothetical protein
MSHQNWPEYLQMQGKVNNIMTNLNMLIDDYSKISNAFSKAIRIQNKKLNNTSTTPLEDDLYNEIFTQRDSLKIYGDELLNNIHTIELNLETLKTNVNYVDIQVNEYIQNVNNVKMSSSNLNSISSNVFENDVDSSNLNPQQIEFIQQHFGVKKGGKSLRKKNTRMKYRKHTKRINRK